MAKHSVCFFAKVRDREALRRVEFYAQDIRILEELGYEVHIATRLSELRRADLYFVWWWTWAFFPVMYAILQRRPSLVTGTFDAWSFPDRPYVHRKMMQFALKHSRANVFVSQLEYNQVQSMLDVTNPRYSPHIVDSDIYFPSAAPREDFIFSVAWMNGLNAVRKCVPEIVRAAAIVVREYPHVRFIIAGEHGSYYPRISEIAQELGVADRIDFPGLITQQQKIEFMRRCKIYLQPSHYEGFGLAILEAMSCGAPIVTSPVGAVPEVVGDAARLVDGASPEDIAAGVKDLLDDSRLAAALGYQARERATALFPFERRKRELREIIDETCS